MADNLFSGIAGGLSGFARTDPLGAGSQFAQGVTRTPLGRLKMAARTEGSLVDVEKDIEAYARFGKATYQYMIQTNYANRPAGAKLLTELLEGTNPPGMEGWSPKEKEDFLNKQIPLIRETLSATTEEAAGAARAGMRPATKQRLAGEGFGDITTPTGFQQWKPETKTAWWKGTRGPESAVAPTSLAGAVESTLSGTNFGEVPVRYQEFQAQRTKLFRELPGSDEDKAIVALLTRGSAAAATEPGYLNMASKDVRAKLELRHTFLIDTDSPEMFKAAADSKGLVDWSKFSSEAIESASPGDILDAWSWLVKRSDLSEQALYFILWNWIGGPDVPKEPEKWPAWGGLK